MRSSGESLIKLLRGAKTTVVLIAPFIKEPVIKRLLAACEQVNDITVVTRWRAEEIAAGVSDLSVLPLLNHHNIQLRLLDKLHAKYYRADFRCLVGSANLTMAGLGWGPNANIEILESIDSERMISFERLVLDTSTAATTEIYDHQQEMAELIRSKNELIIHDEEIYITAKSEKDVWYPTENSVDDFLKTYEEALEISSESTVLIGGLNLPRLTTDRLEKQLIFFIASHPFLVQLEQLISDSKMHRFGEMRYLSRNYYQTSQEIATGIWNNWMQWLLRLFPERYQDESPASGKPNQHTHLFGLIGAEYKN